jgi:hypothetical protein
MYFTSRRKWHARSTTFAHKRRSLTDNLFIEVARETHASLAGVLESCIEEPDTPQMLIESFERHKWVWLVLCRANVPKDARIYILKLCTQDHHYEYVAFKVLKGKGALV